MTEKKITMNRDEVREFIKNCSPESKIYIGADSERLRVDEVWYADYTLAIVVHIDGSHGCKVFGEVQRERDYDYKLSRPAIRLMNEVIKVSEIFIEFADVLEDRYVEIHLDLNPSEKHGSNCVAAQAIGYIKGVCDVEPKIKPEAFAASYTADRLRHILETQYKPIEQTNKYFIPGMKKESV